MKEKIKDWIAIIWIECIAVLLVGYVIAFIAAMWPYILIPVVVMAVVCFTQWALDRAL